MVPPKANAEVYPQILKAGHATVPPFSVVSILYPFNAVYTSFLVAGVIKEPLARKAADPETGAH